MCVQERKKKRLQKRIRDSCGNIIHCLLHLGIAPARKVCMGRLAVLTLDSDKA